VALPNDDDEGEAPDGYEALPNDDEDGYEVLSEEPPFPAISLSSSNSTSASKLSTRASSKDKGRRPRERA